MWEPIGASSKGKTLGNRKVLNDSLRVRNGIVMSVIKLLQRKSSAPLHKRDPEGRSLTSYPGGVRQVYYLVPGLNRGPKVQSQAQWA